MEKYLLVFDEKNIYCPFRCFDSYLGKNLLVWADTSLDFDWNPKRTHCPVCYNNNDLVKIGWEPDWTGV